MSGLPDCVLAKVPHAKVPHHPVICRPLSVVPACEGIYSHYCKVVEALEEYIRDDLETVVRKDPGCDVK